MGEQSFSGYLSGVEKLLNQLGKNNPSYITVLGFQSQLKENVEDARKTDTSELKHHRNQILEQLNRICLEQADTTFDEICFPKQKPTIAHNTIPNSVSFHPVRKDENQSNHRSSGLLKILQVIEHMCYNGDLSLSERKRLEFLITDVAMNKTKSQESGEEGMITSQENFYFESSRTFTQFLISLADYHKEWPDLKFADDRKYHSLNLLKDLHNYLLTTFSVVEQIAEKNPTINSETKKIIKAVEKLRSKLAGIDKYLYSGNPPFELTEDLDENFDNLYFHLSKFVLVLDEIGSNVNNYKLQ